MQAALACYKLGIVVTIGAAPNAEPMLQLQLRGQPDGLISGMSFIIGFMEIRWVFLYFATSVGVY